MFSYVSPEKRVPADHPIRAIRRMADAALAGLSRRFSRMYAWTPSRPRRGLNRPPGLLSGISPSVVLGLKGTVGP